jgi:hypothetical protein
MPTLSRETRSERVRTRACGHCGDVFTPTREHQRFCRPSCRFAHRWHTARREPGLFPDLAREDRLFRTPFE